MVNLVRELPGREAGAVRPAPQTRPAARGVAPAKDRARGRVIELRREGLSTYEISARLAAEGTPLNRTSVAEILAEEGFGRLLRHPAARGQHLPGHPRPRHPAAPHRRGSTSPPGRSGSTPARAGLLLLVPDLVALDLPALVRDAGYPGTRIVPATILAAVPAGAEAHPHPAGLPRR